MEAQMKIAMAQIAPVWLDKQATLDKIYTAVEEAAQQAAQLIVFGEALLPGYPFWLAHLEGAAWDTALNKSLHAHYLDQSVCIEQGDLEPLCQLAKKHKIGVYLGIVERPLQRGGHSLYCSLVYLNPAGEIGSVHRKLQPTYDERLTWSPGDGHGLQTHSLHGFQLGGLNCWENWMPLARASLYAQGENVHIAVWPGSLHNTQDITRFIARESRSYVISVSALMQKSDFPAHTPYFKNIQKQVPDVLANGGSCVAGPDGEWVCEPIVNKAGVFFANLELKRIYEERQNFDPSGHYSRPDVTQLYLDKTRQQILK